MKSLAEYLKLRDLINALELTPGQADEVVWRCTKDGTFSVKSTYHLFIMANDEFASAKPI
jgi:hypothetical protein